MFYLKNRYMTIIICIIIITIIMRIIIMIMRITIMVMSMIIIITREFTFDVDVSQLPCGLNGALYFVEMDEDGGASKYPTNKVIVIKMMMMMLMMMTILLHSMRSRRSS